MTFNVGLKNVMNVYDYDNIIGADISNVAYPNVSFATTSFDVFDDDVTAIQLQGGLIMLSAVIIIDQNSQVSILFLFLFFKKDIERK